MAAVLTGAGRTGGKAEFEEFTITHSNPVLSPKLLYRCAAGVVFPHAYILIRRRNTQGEGTPYPPILKIMLGNVMVSSMSGSAGGTDFETDKFIYQQIVISAFPESGNSKGPLATNGYDIKLNKAISTVPDWAGLP